MSKYALSGGMIAAPVKVVLYGPEGIGKSTFASQFPGAVFIDTEGSTRRMDVQRLPVPTSWAMLMDEVAEVAKGSVPCGTLVIDTADWAERLCISAVCGRFNLKGIEDFNYGKGYTYAKEEFAKLLDRLEEVIESGCNVVITAHSQIVHVEQPDAVGSYDRWTMKTSKQVAPLLREWSDMLLFANYKVLVEKSGTGANAKNKATGGRRVMYTTHHACWDAKNRFGLPEELPFEYAQIANVVASATPTGEKWVPNPVIIVPKQSDPIMVDEEPKQPAPASKPQTTQPTEKKAPETPAADPQPAPKSVQQIESDASKKIAAELSALNYPPALRDLMAADRIDDAMLRHAIHQRGIYPEDMEVPKYSKVVLDNLVSKWHDAWLPFIRENSDIPF